MVRRYRLKRFNVLNGAIECVRDRHISVRVLCLGSSDMQQALFVVDIPPDQIDSLLRSASALQDDIKEKIRGILLITHHKMLALMFRDTPPGSSLVLGEP